MANKFNKGDKVRVTGKRSGASNELDGKICTIHKVSGGGIYVLEEEREGPGGVWEDELESAEERSESAQTNSESELCRLVRKANEGLDAIRTLFEEDVIECRNIALKGNWGRVLSLHEYEVRLKQKPKPAFPEMTVGDGWKVEILDDRDLKVGCHNLGRIDSYTYALKDLIKKGGTYIIGGHGTLVAGRTGISLGSGFTKSGEISWADADRLLEALEKYQHELKDVA